MKKCISCKEIKSFSDFYFRKDNKRYRNNCKECFLISQSTLEARKRRAKNKKLQKQRKPWIFVLQKIKERCNNPKAKNYIWYGLKGIKCLITSDELKELWFRDKAYKMKQPSIDRIDNNGNYEVKNCQFIEMRENAGKNKRHPILQFDLEGNFIKKWKSISEASRQTGVAHSSIWRVIHNLHFTAGGFKWKKI